MTNPIPAEPVIDVPRALKRASMLAAIIQAAKSQAEQALTVIAHLERDLGLPTPETEPPKDYTVGDVTGTLMVPHQHPLLRLATVERQRQVFDKGYTTDHDDQHVTELRRAASAYVMGDSALLPWRREGRRLTPREQLVRAVALLMAEWDRLERAEQQERRGQGQR